MPDEPTPPSARKVAAAEDAKMAKLRQLRLADDAARRAAGTFGDMSVIEIHDEDAGEVFVLSWKGSKLPDLARLSRIRAPGMTLDEHERLQTWLDDLPVLDLKQTLVGWNMNAAEAKRVKDLRIAERKAGGLRIVNDAPVAQAAAAG
jgi:hypothetical protein